MPILRPPSTTSPSGAARTRNLSEASRLPDTQELKRLTAELEVRMVIMIVINKHGVTAQVHVRAALTSPHRLC